MSEQNLSEMTVIELRKLAKDLHVPLRAGISKQGIVERLTEALGQNAPAEEPAPASSPAEEPAPGEKPAPEASARPAPADTPAPGFRSAAAPTPRFNAKPAYQAPAYGNRSATRPTETQRTQTTRNVGFTPRFGPAAQEPPAPREEERPFRPEAPRPAYNADPRPAYGAPQRPAYGDAARVPARPAEAPARPAQEPRGGYDSRPAFETRPAHDARPSYDSRTAHDARPAYDSRPAPDARPAPAAAEMLSPAECPEGSGYLELHPDGYGFLRTERLLPTAKDIFVAASQVRRFGLCAGDHIVGKIRPMRDGDKFAAMLYLSTVNGVAPDALDNRPAFEDLTPIYPRRRIRLTSPDGKTPDALRLMDLIAPIGFGQRGLIICPPGTPKRAFLADLANAIARNHPDAPLTTLLFNETPEEVTALREAVDSPVLASTFDMQPEHHLRLADLAVERAMRQVEMKRDVIILADSLTALSRIFTAAAAQQGRSAPGGVNPASLHKAKRLFGSARCLREGGSLTVIALMNNDPATKLDEAIINEFRVAANMELRFDATLAARGITPAIDLNFSGTRRASGIQTQQEQDALTLIRSVLREVAPDKAIPELLRMLDNAGSGDALLANIRAWVDAVK